MENEEKKVKKTTKKTTAAKKTPAKQVVKKEPVKKVVKKEEKAVVKKEEVVKPIIKEEKKNPAKKPAAKKTTVKKTVSKPTVKKENIESKEIKKETKVEQPEVVIAKELEQKVVTDATPKKKISKELFEIRKKRYIIEAIIIGIVLIIALVLLCNKTFLKDNYKTDAINVSVPRFSYYVKDKDNIVKFYTLRKSANLKEYYDEYLEGFIFYSCAEGNNTFYYNDETKTLIKDIKVEKKFIIKTIEVSYDVRTPEEVCGLR